MKTCVESEIGSALPIGVESSSFELHVRGEIDQGRAGGSQRLLYDPTRTIGRASRNFF